MSITKNSGRQEVVSARVDFTFDDFTDTHIAEAVDMPAGAVVVGGFAVITEAFDSGATLDVGVDGAVTRHASAATADAKGLTGLTLTGDDHAGNEPIGLTLSNGGSATQGAGYVVVNYVVKDRAAFAQG